MIGSLVLMATLQHTLPPATGLHGTYAGPVLNCYSGDCMPGFSWFTVAKDGTYHGQTIAKKPGDACLSHDPKGWTGRLYKLGKHTFYALNDGADEGYILQVSRNRQQAASTYMGAESGVIESNLYFKTTINPDALLSVARGRMCQ